MIYKIPCTFEMYGTLKIEADSLEDAVKYVKEKIDEIPLPEEKYYVDGSFELGTAYDGASDEDNLEYYRLFQK